MTLIYINGSICDIKWATFTSFNIMFKMEDGVVQYGSYSLSPTFCCARKCKATLDILNSKTRTYYRERDCLIPPTRTPKRTPNPTKTPLPTRSLKPTRSPIPSTPQPTLVVIHKTYRKISPIRRALFFLLDLMVLLA